MRFIVAIVAVLVGFTTGCATTRNNAAVPHTAPQQATTATTPASLPIKLKTTEDWEREENQSSASASQPVDTHPGYFIWGAYGGHAYVLIETRHTFQMRRAVFFNDLESRNEGVVVVGEFTGNRSGGVDYMFQPPLSAFDQFLIFKSSQTQDYEHMVFRTTIGDKCRISYRPIPMGISLTISGVTGQLFEVLTDPSAVWSKTTECDETKK